MPVLTLMVDPDLAFLLRADRRRRAFDVRAAETDTVGHVVESVGVPLTEVGRLVLGGLTVPASSRAVDGVLRVTPVVRPQRTTTWPPRFLLDVHLGGLARRLRLLGLDVAHRRQAEDPELVEIAVAERRVLLTQDRGLLRRRRLPEGALVRGAGTDAQVDDVLDRFAPPLAPWTRCTACGSLLDRASAESVADDVEPGTARTYRQFARCTGCGHVFWRGAHAARLERFVAHADDLVARRRG